MTRALGLPVRFAFSDIPQSSAAPLAGVTAGCPDRMGLSALSTARYRDRRFELTDRAVPVDVSRTAYRRALRASRSRAKSATSQASMEQHHDKRRVDPARGIDHKPTPPAGLPDPLRGNPNLTLTSPQLRRPDRPEQAIIMPGTTR